jgi:hypothetical protein
VPIATQTKPRPDVRILVERGAQATVSTSNRHAHPSCGHQIRLQRRASSAVIEFLAARRLAELLPIGCIIADNESL